MSQLTEKDFLDIKDEIRNGRLSPGSIRVFLGAFMFFSLIMVGIAYMGVAASNSVIGWEKLSIFWQTVFKLQAILFVFQLVLIFLVRGKNNWSQILLTISYVFYTYKMVLDPFVMTLIYTKDQGVYEVYAPLVILIIILGFLFHIFFIIHYFKDLKKGNKNKEARENKSNSKLIAFTPFLFLLVGITGYIIRNDLLGDTDILFFLAIDVFLLVAIMIGAVEFVMGAYCVIRFPSFRVNPPSTKKKNA